jgi:Tfp pilus assembly protein PilO
MAKGTSVKIPQRSIQYFLLCLFGVVIFVFVGIVPSHMNLKDLDQDIKKLQFNIEEQKTLLPLYDTLKKRGFRKESSVLPLPAKVPLPRDQLPKLSSTLRDAAKQSGMEVVNLTPDLKSLSSDSKSLSLSMTLNGEFPSFRKFLLALEAMPFFENMEEVRIRQHSGGTELVLKIWVAIT